jgi:hypothetical protein
MTRITFFTRVFFVRYDARVYEPIPGTPDYDAGYQGFVRLSFEENMLTINHYSLAGGQGQPNPTSETLLVTESFRSDGRGSVQALGQSFVSPDMTLVSHH